MKIAASLMAVISILNVTLVSVVLVVRNVPGGAP